MPPRFIFIWFNTHAIAAPLLLMLLTPPPLYYVLLLRHAADYDFRH